MVQARKSRRRGGGRRPVVVALSGFDTVRGPADGTLGATPRYRLEGGSRMKPSVGTRLSAIPGLAVLGAMATGTAGLVLAVWKLTDGQSGVYLLAAAVAFGLLANATFRD